MWSCSPTVLALVFACLTAASSFSETLTGFNTLGDHFGYPAFANATYDYVVVGGGTAGLAVAARLAEGNAGTVAVVEAGGFYEMDNGNLSTVPGTAGYFVGTGPGARNPLIDWQYQTEPNPGLGGRSITYNSGKTLGGGSARNYMLYIRGSEGSYAKWADEVGDDSYKLSNWLPFFQKSVRFTPANNLVRAANASVYTSPPLYGLAGPLRVTFSNWANTWASWGRLALREVGLVAASDFVTGKLLGYGYAAQTIDAATQTRSSAETAYLRAAMEAGSRLVVYKSSVAKRVLFEGTAAVGVRVETGGVGYSLMAAKEVIVSAGVHRSPQLLMVSGVGPQETLSRLGIPLVSDLAGVGQNMWDQPFFGPSYPVGIQTHSSLAQPDFQQQQVNQYRESRTGLLTNPGSDFVAWENLPDDLWATLSPATRRDLVAQFPPDWPILQHTLADAFYGTGGDMLTGAPTDGRQYASILPTLVATFSRGSVTINSTDTSINPIIYSNLLSDTRDQEIAVAAFKRARQIAATRALRSIITGPEAAPGPAISSDADILAAIMNTTSPIWHASGTCKMGKQSDGMAVVDAQANVYGVSRLRVVDASTFPVLVPCHPQATVYALAEKIAAAILQGRKRSAA
ncbi:hypothetical protein CDD81_4041 [Ophiocordyceps australis]|uniref:Glucose-methanol-choline oxidoreductase N-terminal domain-containing protein n=1 Tax=Ophiocordyceps australis TaxID=1399860 RepID=A0A2C5XAJ8_9HYPO|nr:hypothetical protein CDD81_4041 [Ophiocordyceps australis]